MLAGQLQRMFLLMLSHMILGRHYHQVADVVVPDIFITVMHLFTRQKRAAKVLLHDVPMLQLGFPVDLHGEVSISHAAAP